MNVENLVRDARFIKSATRPSQFPPSELPEVAFAGRSNVGKSSMINSLVNRRKLVKTSGTPGHTQLINFFELNDALSFVDLPGYGFARVPHAVRDSWGAMIDGYLSQRENLRAMICIMDIRRGAQDDDMQLIQAAPHFDIQPILVFTKADKLKRNKRYSRHRELARELRCNVEDIILFSSTERFGLDELWKRILDLTNADMG